MVEGRDYQYLSEWSDRCAASGAEVGDDRARQMLTVLAQRGRAVLAVIDAEPGLHAHLECLAYGRAVALLAEITRQAYHLIRTALRYEADGPHPRRDTALTWDEAEALTGRADELGTAAVQHSPRLELDTVAGSHAMSRRLVNLHQLGEAADTVDAALADARRFAHPDPAVDALAALAEGLREQAAALRSTAGGEDWWAGYFERSRREAEAARERERAESERLYAQATAARS